jgi:hypothetical protein
MSSLRGDQPQRGHRMHGADGSWLFSSSSSRSKTLDPAVTFTKLEFPFENSLTLSHRSVTETVYICGLHKIHGSEGRYGCRSVSASEVRSH